MTESFYVLVEVHNMSLNLILKILAPNPIVRLYNGGSSFSYKISYSNIPFFHEKKRKLKSVSFNLAINGSFLFNIYH